MKVFISWSGEVSKRLGALVGEWLECTLLNIEAIYTPKYLRAGTQGTAHLYRLLEEVHTGILIYTPESINSQWMIFEAGALFKSAEQSIIIPLLFHLEYEHLPGPIQTYQWKVFGKEQLFQVLQAVNQQLGQQQIKEEKLRYVFEREWPEFYKEVQQALLEIKPIPSKTAADLSLLLQTTQQLQKENNRLREQLKTSKNSPSPFVPSSEVLRQKRILDSRLYALEQRLSKCPRILSLPLSNGFVLHMTPFGWVATIVLLPLIFTKSYLLIVEPMSLADRQLYGMATILCALTWSSCLFFDIARRSTTVRLQAQRETLLSQRAQLERDH